MSRIMKQRFVWGGACTAVVLGALGFGWQMMPSYETTAQAVEPAVARAIENRPAEVRNQLAIAADLSMAFNYVAEELKPSVVRIGSVTRSKPIVDRRGSTNRQLPPGFPEEFRRFFEDDLGGRMAPRQMPEQQGLGSGVIVTPDGYILTNNHVVRGADEVTVTLMDEREYRAKIVGSDAKTDLAVLKIDAQGLTAARLGDSDKMKVGEWVLAVGCPFGLEQTVTAGIISARGRVMGIIEGGYEDFLQTDAAINPGNSGGPLVNLQGEVIGINSAIESRNGGNMGIGFAIPTNLARSVMDALIKDGKVVRGWLGASIQPLDESLADSFGFKGRRGVLIGSVMPNSPAEKAGLKDGDIVTELNGRRTDTVSQLRNGIAALAPKSKADLLVYRNGKAQHVQVIVGELSGQDVVATASPGEESESSQELGVTVVPLTKKLADEIGFEGELQGVVVTDVEQGSMAERAFIRPGDVIVMLGSKEVNDVNDYRDALEKFDSKKGIRIQIERDGVRRFVFLRSGS